MAARFGILPALAAKAGSPGMSSPSQTQRGSGERMPNVDAHEWGNLMV
jgi:hypothetical protein